MRPGLYLAISTTHDGTVEMHQLAQCMSCIHTACLHKPPPEAAADKTQSAFGPSL